MILYKKKQIEKIKSKYLFTVLFLCMISSSTFLSYGEPLVLLDPKAVWVDVPVWLFLGDFFVAEGSHLQSFPGCSVLACWVGQLFVVGLLDFFFSCLWHVVFQVLTIFLLLFPLPYKYVLSIYVYHNMYGQIKILKEIGRQYIFLKRINAWALGEDLNKIQFS